MKNTIKLVTPEVGDDVRFRHTQNQVVRGTVVDIKKTIFGNYKIRVVYQYVIHKDGRKIEEGQKVKWIKEGDLINVDKKND